MIRIAILKPGGDEPFPPVSRALADPNGLLAAGGDLSPSRLVEAYRHGIFPWFSPGEPILWWSPDPRMVFATDAMHAAYNRLHHLGHAHSFEVYDAGDRLVGGIYGVAIGRMFFGESMFSGVSGGSKVALLGLAHVLRGWGWPLIDAQVSSAHLTTLGAFEMPRGEFVAAIERLTAQPGRDGDWNALVTPFAASTLPGG